MHMAGRMDGIQIEDRGVSSFKGISEPVGVIRVTGEGEDPARWFADHAQLRRSQGVRGAGVGWDRGARHAARRRCRDPSVRVAWIGFDVDRSRTPWESLTREQAM